MRNPLFLGLFYLGMFVWLLASCVSSCEPLHINHEQDLNEIGIYQGHQVRRLIPKDNPIGTISGSFFLGSGRLETSSSSTIKFDWAPTTNTRITTEIPIDKIITQIDNSLNGPVIYFDLDRQVSLAPALEDYAHHKTSQLDFNSLLSDYLIKATVKISETDLKDNPALPQ